MAQNSPYVSLVNFCYQLRHENEELIEAVNLKSGLVEACEKEIHLLKERIVELENAKATESEEALSDRLQVSSDRYVLMERNMRLETQLREYEVRSKSVEAQFSIAQEQIALLQSSPRHSSFETVVQEHSQPISTLKGENERLRKQLETASFILTSKRRRVGAPSKQESPSAPKETVLHVSSDDSLLRVYEKLVGYSIVKSEKTVTLVSNLDENMTVRLRLGETNEDSISVLSSEGIDEASLAVLRAFNSVPGLLSKLTLSTLASSVFKAQEGRERV